MHQLLDTGETVRDIYQPLETVRDLLQLRDTKVTVRDSQQPWETVRDMQQLHCTEINIERQPTTMRYSERRTATLGEKPTNI